MLTSGRLAIVGSSALGRQLAGHAMLAGKFEFVGFFDDFAPQSGEVIGKTPDIGRMFAAGVFDCLAIGVGYKAMAFRHGIMLEHLGKVPLADIAYASAFVDPSAKVGEGCVLLHNAVVDQRAEIGPNCFLSIAASVSHDSILGASSYLSPRATVCGDCNVGERTFLGAGCILRDGVRICDDVVIGAGAVVVKDIERPGTYVGNPAHRLEKTGNSHDKRKEVD